MNLGLKGKNALVCGSSKGIGKAIAREIALLGANVTLVSRSPQLMTDVVHELDNSRGQHHDFLSADFSQPHELRKMVIGLVDAKPIHVLVNNTGGPPAGPILDAEPDDFLKAYTAHLICNQLLTQLVVPGMKKEDYGRIINVISTSVKSPIKGLGVSNTTRGAVANWAKTMANELGPYGITVNNVLPGATNTGRLQSIIENKSKKSGDSLAEVAQQMKASIPLGRFAEPEEIAAAAAFLASPAAAYITGTNVVVDGGRTSCL